MRIDLHYLSSILEVFLVADTTFIKLPEFRNAGINFESDPDCFEERFVYHMQLAIDNQLIGKRSGLALTIKDIGLHQAIDGKASLLYIPIQLTKKGHDFACALKKTEVRLRLQLEFNELHLK